MTELTKILSSYNIVKDLYRVHPGMIHAREWLKNYKLIPITCRDENELYLEMKNGQVNRVLCYHNVMNEVILLGRNLKQEIEMWNINDQKKWAVLDEEEGEYIIGMASD